MLDRLHASPSWRYFATMTRAVPGLAAAWWALLLLRALLPAALAVTTGMVVGAVAGGETLTPALASFGVAFVLAQITPAVHQVVGTLLGHRFSNALNDRLMAATLDPDGIGHLERGDLTNDFVAARDFDLGMTGPPLYLNMDFIAAGLVTLLGGIASALVLVGFAWWAPILLLLGWGCTHWLMRESAVWRDRNTDEVRSARRHSDYAYSLATEPAPAKEVRLFGLEPWLLDRFRGSRLHLHELQYAATRLREKSLAGALLIVIACVGVVMWAIAERAYAGEVGLDAAVTYATATFASSAIAFGGLGWAMDVGSAPVLAIERLEPLLADAGSLGGPGGPPAGARPPVTGSRVGPAIEFRGVTFAYPATGRPILRDFSLGVSGGESLAIVGQNGAGKTTIAKLLCRMYDPQAGAILIDGVDLRDIPLDSWRERLAAVFQDFVRYELSLRENVSPLHADDDRVRAALAAAGADRLAPLHTPMAKGYPGGIDVSGGQWQRVALARAIAAAAGGADVVLLDEPTAMLDVRGEGEIFRRLLAETDDATTVLISHRFSTVRQADRIVVVEHGRVAEDGTHDELMRRDGRYRTMYRLQASRFVEVDEAGEQVVYDTL